MEKTKQKIADMVSDMDFGRKPPVSQETKLETAALCLELGEVMKDLSKLHLGLCYAVQNGDYRSLPLKEAKREIAKAAGELEKLK